MPLPEPRSMEVSGKSLIDGTPTTVTQPAKGTVTWDANGVATPEGWLPGQPVIVPPPKTSESADRRKDEGYDYVDWYFSRKTL